MDRQELWLAMNEARKAKTAVLLEEEAAGEVRHDAAIAAAEQSAEHWVETKRAHALQGARDELHESERIDFLEAVCTERKRRMEHRLDLIKQLNDPTTPDTRRTDIRVTLGLDRAKGCAGTGAGSAGAQSRVLARLAEREPTRVAGTMSLADYEDSVGVQGVSSIDGYGGGGGGNESDDDYSDGGSGDSDDEEGSDNDGDAALTRSTAAAAAATTGSGGAKKDKKKEKKARVSRKKSRRRKMSGRKSRRDASGEKLPTVSVGADGIKRGRVLSASAALGVGTHGADGSSGGGGGASGYMQVRRGDTVLTVPRHANKLLAGAAEAYGSGAAGIGTSAGGSGVGCGAKHKQGDASKKGKTDTLKARAAKPRSAPAQRSALAKGAGDCALDLLGDDSMSVVNAGDWEEGARASIGSLPFTGMLTASVEVGLETNLSLEIEQRWLALEDSLRKQGHQLPTRASQSQGLQHGHQLPALTPSTRPDASVDERRRARQTSRMAARSAAHGASEQEVGRLDSLTRDASLPPTVWAQQKPQHQTQEAAGNSDCTADTANTPLPTWMQQALDQRTVQRSGPPSDFHSASAGVLPLPMPLPLRQPQLMQHMTLHQHQRLRIPQHIPQQMQHSTNMPESGAGLACPAMGMDTAPLQRQVQQQHQQQASVATADLQAQIMMLQQQMSMQQAQHQHQEHHQQQQQHHHLSAAAVPAFFDATTSTLDKGRHRLRDVREFDPQSLRRITDTDTPTVSLLIGRAKDASTAVAGQQVSAVTVMFDRAAFNDDQARSWWATNRGKYI